MIYFLAAVQFINILEFMIVMPLGPDFAKDLGIPTSHLGIIAGSYTAAAAVAGIVGSFFLDRFDRRKAMAVAMIGLVISTAAVGMARNFEMLVVGRVFAGCFGGPATSLSLAIIADIIPPERRGRAMGIVMGSYALASVAGVPAGLELAYIGGWQLPFFAVAGTGLVLAGFSIFKLPPLRLHLDHANAAKQAGHKSPTFIEMLSRSVVLTSFAMSSLVMLGMFLVIPNISAYIQGNLGYPRDKLSFLYLAGGAVSFFTLQLAGKLVDRYGPVGVGSAGSLMMMITLYVGYVIEPPTSAVLPIFVAFMICSTFRNVPMQALTSQVPFPPERARFMSLQSAAQNLSIAFGSFLSSVLLSQGDGGRLEGMATVGWLSVAFSTTMPVMLYYVQRMVKAQQSAIPLSSAGK